MGGALAGQRGGGSGAGHDSWNRSSCRWVGGATATADATAGEPLALLAGVSVCVCCVCGGGVQTHAQFELAGGPNNTRTHARTACMFHASAPGVHTTQGPCARAPGLPRHAPPQPAVALRAATWNGQGPWHQVTCFATISWHQRSVARSPACHDMTCCLAADGRGAGARQVRA